ncbi:MAG TPA: hypothetical protein VEF76_14190 [Patescibacteria group bacterium]|nr:hypothetical protein [Patescibacteria group bacterium]
MLGNILSTFGLTPQIAANDRSDARRAPRHKGMEVQVIIGRRAYPVHDWNRSAISFETPDHNWNIGRVYYETAAVPEMKEGGRHKVTLRFQLLQGAVEVPVEAEILRVEGARTVATLQGISRETARKFDNVIDSFNAQRFLESQTANA